MSAATPARTGLEHVVVQIRRAGTVPALHAAVAAMAHGRDLDVVLGELAEMLEQDLADTAVEIAHGWDGERFSHVRAGSIALLALDDAHAAGTPWAMALEQGDVVLLDDLSTLPPSLRTIAVEAGVTAVGVHPVRVRTGEPCDAAVVVWRRSHEGFSTFSRQTLEQAGDLVALALQWHEGRRALEWAAEHDPLTGLANRRAFVKRLEDATGAASAVLYVDLDNFKPVNEDHGHLFGDKVLAVVGERLRGCVRPGDVVARIGGDEFAVLCPGLTDRATIDDLLVRLGDAVGRPITIEGRTVRVGASVGVASTHDGSNVDAILEAADVRLRQAKAAKRTYR